MFSFIHSKIINDFKGLKQKNTANSSRGSLRPASRTMNPLLNLSTGSRQATPIPFALWIYRQVFIENFNRQVRLFFFEVF